MGIVVGLTLQAMILFAVAALLEKHFVKSHIRHDHKLLKWLVKGTDRESHITCNQKFIPKLSAIMDLVGILSLIKGSAVFRRMKSLITILLF